jgi:hypothetical protein
LVFLGPNALGDALIEQLFLSVVNGFFVFCAASGATSIGDAVQNSGPAGSAQARNVHPSAPGSRKFWTTWF